VLAGEVSPDEASAALAAICAPNPSLEPAEIARRPAAMVRRQKVEIG
jgi:hypothetical protein